MFKWQNFDRYVKFNWRLNWKICAISSLKWSWYNIWWFCIVRWSLINSRCHSREEVNASIASVLHGQLRCVWSDSWLFSTALICSYLRITDEFGTLSSFNCSFFVFDKSCYPYNKRHTEKVRFWTNRVNSCRIRYILKTIQFRLYFEIRLFTRRVFIWFVAVIWFWQKYQVERR